MSRDSLQRIERIVPNNLQPTEESLKAIAKEFKRLAAVGQSESVVLGEVINRVLSAFKFDRHKHNPFGRKFKVSEVLAKLSEYSGYSSNTLRKYGQLVKFYGGAEAMLRLMSQYPSLGIEHFTLAKAGRKMSEAFQTLDRYRENNWTVDDAKAFNLIEERSSTRYLRRKRRIRHGYIRNVTGNTFVFELSEGQDDESVQAALREWFVSHTQLSIFIEQYGSDRPLGGWDNHPMVIKMQDTDEPDAP